MNEAFQITDPPPIDAVRPASCPNCGVPAGTPGRLNIWGHGRRKHYVIVPGACVVTAWVWRFLCIRCKRTCSVSPPEVLSRYRYTLPAILMAFFFAIAPPIGDDEDDEAVYALVGVDRRVPGPDPDRAGRPRWRSLWRWTKSFPRWWPTRPVTGETWRVRASALIAGFIPGDGGRGGAIRRALAVHSADGRPM